MGKGGGTIKKSKKHPEVRACSNSHDTLDQCQANQVVMGQKNTWAYTYMYRTIKLLVICNQDGVILGVGGEEKTKAGMGDSGV